MKTTHNLLFLLLALLASTAVYLGNQDSNYESTERILQSTIPDYTTNPIRTQSVTAGCAGRDRNNMVSADSQSENDVYKAQMAAQFSLDAYLSFNCRNLFISFLLNNNSQAALDMLSGTVQTELIVFAGPFFLGLLLILILWPCLCCCCVCPSCCPSKCCQKDDQEAYSKCQLIWPGIVLMIALLLACVSSIIGTLKSIKGFTRAGNLSNGISNVACSGFILFDDFVNGNVTSDGQSFFIGVSTLVSQLSIFNNTIDSIDTTLSDLRSGGVLMTATQPKITLAITKVSEIPSGVANGILSLPYNTPINTASPTVALDSTFIGVLGSQADDASAVGGVIKILESLGDTLTTIGTAVDDFSGSVPGFKTQVGTVQTAANDFQQKLFDLDAQVYALYEDMDTVLSAINTGIAVFFGVVILLTIVGIIGLLLMTFCDKFKCRYLIYIACLILFVIGIIGFIIAVVFSAVIPVIYFGCEWIDFSLSSAANFNSNTAGVLDSTTASYITTCFVTSSGDIISVLAPQIATTLNSATSSITGINTFDSSALNSQINSIWDSLGTTITQYLDSDLPDLDTSQLAILTKLSTSSNYACTDSKFSGDSWIPSTDSVQTAVPCQISGGTIVTATCLGGDFGTGANGCGGCIDTTRILNTNTTAGDALAALNTRYTNADCATFNSQLSDTWENYYLPKKVAISTVETRYNAANTQVTDVINEVTVTIPGVFNTVISTLQATADSITNPTTGIIAGFNCRIVGEDINRFVNVFCLEAFNNMYFLRLILGIASFGILFAMCCSVCAGVRHYKHSERIGKIPTGNQMNANNQYRNNQYGNNQYGINQYGNENTNAAFNMKY